MMKLQFAVYTNNDDAKVYDMVGDLGVYAYQHQDHIGVNILWGIESMPYTVSGSAFVLVGMVLRHKGETKENLIQTWLTNIKNVLGERASVEDYNVVTAAAA